MGQPLLLRYGVVCGGRVWEGTVQLAWLSTGFQSLPPLATSKLGPSGADSPGGWICLCFRTLWVSPVNSPVRLGISPATATPTGFYSQRFWGFISLALEPWLAWSVLLSSGSSWFIHMQMWGQLVLQLLPCSMSSLHWLPISTPPTSLDECSFFNSLVVGLPYSSIFWPFWLFFVFKFVVVLLLVVWGGKVYLSMPPSLLEVQMNLLIHG